MTNREFYERMTRDLRYKTDGCYPSTRYSETCGKDLVSMTIKDAKILVNGFAYTPHDIVLDSNLDGAKITASAYLNPFNVAAGSRAEIPPKPLTITNVIFNPPATIVFWSDKTKTIVKCDYDHEYYDPEKGIAMAIAKKLMGDNKGSYYEVFKHWRRKWDEQNEVKINVDIPKSPLDKLANDIKKAFGKPVVIKEADSNGEEKD